MEGAGVPWVSSRLLIKPISEHSGDCPWGLRAWPRRSMRCLEAKSSFGFWQEEEGCDLDSRASKLVLFFQAQFRNEDAETSASQAPACVGNRSQTDSGEPRSRPPRARSFCTGRFGHPTWGPQQLKAKCGRDGIAFQSVRGRLCVLLEAACVLACGPALSLQGQQPVEPSSPGFLGSLTRSGRRGQRTSLCGPPGRGIRRAVGVLGMGARGACTCQRCVDFYTGC